VDEKGASLITVSIPMLTRARCVKPGLSLLILPSSKMTCLRSLPKGWAEMIRKVYEVDPLICPSCGGRMRIVSFIEDPKVIDRIIRHLELSFEAERPPPPHHVQQELLTAAGGGDGGIFLRACVAF